MKKDLIIIPGVVNPKIANHRLIKPIAKHVRSLLKITPEIKFRYGSFIETMSPFYDNIEVLEYKRELFSMFDKENIRIVANRLSNIKNEYDLVCFSFGGFGGHLVQEALKNKNLKKPSKIILMFSTNLDKKIKFPNETKVFNIYSTKDFLSKNLGH